jgi:hypothetical protein
VNVMGFPVRLVVVPAHEEDAPDNPRCCQCVFYDERLPTYRTCRAANNPEHLACLDVTHAVFKLDLPQP